jgi:flagellar biosynthetic protein FliP
MSLAILAATTPSVTVNLGGSAKPTSSIIIIVGLAVLAAAPAALLLLTPFTQVLVTLKIVGQAIGLNGIPPPQVLAGLALFIAAALIEPTMAKSVQVGIRPWLNGRLAFGPALSAAEGPFRIWMLHHTHGSDIQMFLNATGHAKTPIAKAPMVDLIPAYTISSIETAMLMGFVVYIPFVVIDLIVSSILMSTGIVMLPPTLISLPFKILLFVLVDGWALVGAALLKAG